MCEYVFVQFHIRHVSEQKKKLRTKQNKTEENKWNETFSIASFIRMSWVTFTQNPDIIIKTVIFFSVLYIWGKKITDKWKINTFHPWKQFNGMQEHLQSKRGG